MSPNLFLYQWKFSNDKTQETYACYTVYFIYNLKKSDSGVYSIKPSSIYITDVMVHRAAVYGIMCELLFRINLFTVAPI